MRSLPAIVPIFIGIIVGALLLPAVMFGSFQIFAGQGGDVPILLRRFEGVNGTAEQWAKLFYGLTGEILGGLSGYFLICLHEQKWHYWVRLLLAVIAYSLLSILRIWYQVMTDGYNTPGGAVVLLWLPTLWSVSLLAWSLRAARRLGANTHGSSVREGIGK
jgi:hypothetical protein